MKIIYTKKYLMLSEINTCIVKLLIYISYPIQQKNRGFNEDVKHNIKCGWTSEKKRLVPYSIREFQWG